MSTIIARDDRRSAYHMWAAGVSAAVRARSAGAPVGFVVVGVRQLGDEAGWLEVLQQHVLRVRVAPPE